MWMTEVRACLVVSVFCVLAGCRQQMGQQPAYRPLEASTFFEDGRSAREPVHGTVARSFMGDDEAPALFKQDDVYVDSLPYPITPDLLGRGQQRFNIYCAPCHGQTGDGNGMIVLRGFSHPPSLHADDVRHQPVGFYVDVITNGYGAMAGYSAQVAARDRWAIAAYIRALQLSQHATMDDVPPTEQSRLTNKDKAR